MRRLRPFLLVISHATETPSSLRWPLVGHANKARILPRCRRPCWRRPAGKALILRRATPTKPGFCRPAGAHVGVALLAKPLSSVGPRQQGPPFPALPAPMLESPSRQSLCLPSSHANKPRPFPRCRSPCWRHPPGKALIHRRVTPTRLVFSSAAGAHVGVTLPAKPLSSVGPRQQGPPFPATPAPMLASSCPQSLNPPSGHANKARPFPHCRRPCWRRPARKALIHRRGTPTRPALSRTAGAHVGVVLPAKP